MKVKIYGTSWCTFCQQAKSLCESKSLSYEYIDVDDTSNLRDLEQKIGQKVKSVPQIFIDDKFIPGGYSGFSKEISNA